MKTNKNKIKTKKSLKMIYGSTNEKYSENPNVQQGNFLSVSEITNIFDKIFKKCITLSSKAVIRMINGIYGTNHSDDSKISYNWTELVKDNEKLDMILADCIITVNEENSYHMEAQAYNDGEIVFRVFDYSFLHAKRNTQVSNNRYRMKFPKPVIIYLYYTYEVADMYIIEFEFEDESDSYEYKVPVIKIPELSSDEMNRRNMVILIPFKLLKLREWVTSDGKTMTKTPEELKLFIENDIIRIINDNLKAGNITDIDACKLKDYTLKLRDYICDHLGAEGLEEVRGMTDHSFMTEVDIICETYENKIDDLQKDNDNLQTVNSELQTVNSELQTVNSELQTVNSELQTVNIELQTVNSELQTANSELQTANDEITKENVELRQRLSMYE